MERAREIVDSRHDEILGNVARKLLTEPNPAPGIVRYTGKLRIDSERTMQMIRRWERGSPPAFGPTMITIKERGKPMRKWADIYQEQLATSMWFDTCDSDLALFRQMLRNSKSP